MMRKLWIASLLLFTLPLAAEESAWSYADLDQTLERYVTDDGWVDYDALQADSEPLERYVEAMRSVSPDSHPQRFSSREEQLAYWMNAYNALMLHRVVQAWPIESVREIRALYGVFWRETHELGGVKWSLRGLENKIIRKRYNEPRIHFGINCASAGCPALPKRAWRANSLDRDLDRATRRFIADERNVRFSDGVVELSSIFKWFSEDFTSWLKANGHSTERGVLEYVLRYVDDESIVRGDGTDRPRVRFLPYDWSINAAPIDPE